MPEAQLIEQIKNYLQTHEAEYLALLEQMVNINSFSANPQGVNALGEVTAVAFSRLGFNAETIQAENPLYGRHLWLTRHGRSHHQIVLISHLDTVFPAEEEERHDFHWRRVQRRIYGPGAIDIKGGTVLIYMLLDALQQHRPDLFNAVTWHIGLNACEEVSEDDFGRLCRARLGEDTLACLVFEAGYMRGHTFQVVVARKGMANYHIEVEGKAAHAGSAHAKGANAIVQMAEVIKQIHHFTDYKKDLTFNVGTVMGGTVSNRVPHYAAASVEMRAFDTAVYQQGVHDMLSLNELTSIGSANGDFTCRTQVMITGQTQPWPVNPATERLLAIWQEAGETLGYTVRREERGGLSDGNHLWAHIPTLDGLGPSGGNAHCSERSDDGRKEQEYLYVPSLIPKTLLNVTAVVKLLGEEIGD
ncbi:MAG TPA: M20/M25/M40 family metallo-hydrolase [Chloroflexota bacterium]|nr:M20/M25/M40 family metallo-hydrolase [Chloroflexota bacterium]